MIITKDMILKNKLIILIYIRLHKFLFLCQKIKLIQDKDRENKVQMSESFNWILIMNSI